MKKIKTLTITSLALMILCSCSRYDHDKPDTKDNRAGFQYHFGFEPQNNVTGVYFFADEWGGDASYWFAFSAPQEVLDRIMKKWNLKQVAERNDHYTPPVKEIFPWWNLSEREKSQYYEFRDASKETDCYLWYNPEMQKCQAVIVYW